MTASEFSAPQFDPFSPDFIKDPYPQYAMLREEAPVLAHPAGFWLLSRYEDVSWLLRAPGLSVDDRNVTDRGLFAVQDAVDDGEHQWPRGQAMVDRDPPDHTRLRRLVSKAFTPRTVARLRPRITELVDGMLGTLVGAGEADLVEVLAYPLPFTVIADLLGTPAPDHERIQELTGVLERKLEVVNDPRLSEEIGAAHAELAAIAAEMIAWKRKNPADDLLTALIRAEDDGDVLDDSELIAQTVLLYIAGHETTVNLLAGGTLALLRNPDQFQLLRDDPGLIPNAVEEMMRYDSPVQASRRIALEPVTVGGTVIPAGSFVMAVLASANRDERHFGSDAAEFQVTRDDARQHLSFSAGIHHCLGASLARLEASIVFERMIAVSPGLELAGEVAWNGRINLRGPAKLPVRAGHAHVG